MTVHDFGESLSRGEGGEDLLDSFFSKWYDIKPATREEQRQGIDRHFTRLDTGDHSLVEYKTDWKASETGNAFIETVSVDTADKAGWAHTSKADWLVYFLPNSKVIYIAPFGKLREALPEWLATYPVRPAINRGYNTHGVLVPLAEFEKCTVRTYRLEDD